MRYIMRKHKRLYKNLKVNFQEKFTVLQTYSNDYINFTKREHVRQTTVFPPMPFLFCARTYNDEENFGGLTNYVYNNTKDYDVKKIGIRNVVFNNPLFLPLSAPVQCCGLLRLYIHPPNG